MAALDFTCGSLRNIDIPLTLCQIWDKVKQKNKIKVYFFFIYPNQIGAGPFTN